MTKLKEFTKREVVQEVIDELQELVDCVEPTDPRAGLCAKIHEIFFEILERAVSCDFPSECFRAWEAAKKKGGGYGGT